MEHPGDEDAVIAAVAALNDPVRQRLYQSIREAGRPLTREEGARAVGISRKLAAFHLDKLVTVGLLTAAVSDGAPRRVGRAPKVYRPANDSIGVSIPRRAYADLASILVEAVQTQRPDEPTSVSCRRVAEERGNVAGLLAGRDARGRRGLERALTMTRQALTSEGYEPYEAKDGRQPVIRLRNCPFHPLASDAPELVCQINGAFLSGLLDGLGAEPLEIVPVSADGECCAEIRAKAVVRENVAHDRRRE
jgi:predicted ArsR family transcriptional regulator